MLLLFFIFIVFSIVQGNEGDVPPSQFLHKTPSKVLERMLTETAGGINLAFNIDTQEDTYNDIRRPVPEVRIVELDEAPRPLEELRREQDNSRFARSTGPSFDRGIYDFMVPAGRQKQSTPLAVLKFTTTDSSDVSFAVTMDRLKWFKLGDPKQAKKADSIEYEVPVLLAPGVDVRPELTKNSVYKFNIEAHQGEQKVSSRVRVEIFSFSPTTKRIKPTEEGNSQEQATPTSPPEIEGSAEESNDLILTSAVTTPESPRQKSTVENAIATMTDDQLLTTTPKETQIEIEGSGNVEKTGILAHSTEREDEEDPLSEVITMATPIIQREMTKDVEITVTGTNGDIVMIGGNLSRGDMIRGIVISGNSKKANTEWLTLSSDQPEVVSIRPGRIEPGGKAYLFCNHPDFEGELRIKVSISDGTTADEKEIVFKRNKREADPSMMILEFKVPEDAPSGTIIGSIENGDQMKIVGKPGLFALVGNEIILSCSSEAPCLDHESERIHYLLLVAKDGSMRTMKISIQILDTNDNTPVIEPTDNIIRLSDGHLIMPFAIQIVDDDSLSAQENVLSIAGDAANFLQLEKIDTDLYQVRVEGSPSSGRYELLLRVDDGVHHSRKTHKTIKVLVQNSHSHAHFRRTRYDRNVTSESVLPGVEVVRVELEGVPIDEARFVILSGNPGWITVDDYGGTVSFKQPRRLPQSGNYEITVAALNRETGKILAKTTVSITILGAAVERKVFDRTLYEKTMDREESSAISIELPGSIQLDPFSVLAIDENGQKRDIKPTDISVKGGTITLNKKAVSTMRVIRMEIHSGQEKATVIFHLISSDSFVENKRKMTTRPVFPPLSEVLEIVEELPVGYVVSTVPAVHPMTGELLPLRLEGDDGLFSLDQTNGVLEVAKRMDYEDVSTPKEVLVKFISGEVGYESTTQMKIRLLDVDDNPPVIDKKSVPRKITVAEDVPVGTEILSVPVSDKDAVNLEEGLVARLEGPSKKLFKALMTNDTISIQVAKPLDREETAQHSLQLVVADSGKHEDSLLIIVDAEDVNDNSPKFSRDVYNVHVVENWPARLVLDAVKATDLDSMERGHVTYSLISPNSKYFILNETTGQLEVAQDLMGMAREEPYILRAIASDGGTPPRNITVPIRIAVSEPKRIKQTVVSFSSPPMDYILQLGDPLPADGKIYRAKTTGDGRNIKYSIRELFGEKGRFQIDAMSGDVMVVKPLNKRGEYILVISAVHVPSGVDATRFLRIQYTPSNRPTPRFPEGAPLYFLFNDQKPLGHIKASIEDGGDIFYYLIPSCSPLTGLFSLNSTSGELAYRGAEPLPAGRTELCVLASNKQLTDTASLVYDKERTDNIVVEIVGIREKQELPHLIHINNTIVTFDHKLHGMKIQVEEDEAASFYNFSLSSVSFLPSESVLPLTTAAPLPSLFRISPQGLARPSCSLATQPSGVYSVKISAKPGEDMLNQEFHLVPSSSRLRFIFDRQLMSLAKDFHNFERELKKTLGGADQTLRLILDQPRATAANISRSSMCFHAVGLESLLSAQTAVNRLSAIEDLFSLYHRFGIIDIAKGCEEPAVIAVAESSSLSSPLSLFVFSVLAFSSLFFFLVCVYFCFVRRYRDYLKAKEKAMKGPPQQVPSTPTFVLAPPIVQPPLGYWE